MKCLAALLFVSALAAQQFQFNLGHLESKSSNAVDISLNGSTLQFAARFLSDRNPDEARVKKLISRIEGIYVKSFEFRQAGAWSPADLDNVRNQLKAPEWSRIVGFKSSDDGEMAEVYVRFENEKNAGYRNQKINGLAVLVTNPQEFTVVNIAGAVDLDALADLSGYFGVPKLKIGAGKEKK